MAVGTASGEGAPDSGCSTAAVLEAAGGGWGGCACSCRAWAPAPAAEGGGRVSAPLRRRAAGPGGRAACVPPRARRIARPAAGGHPPAGCSVLNSDIWGPLKRLGAPNGPARAAARRLGTWRQVRARNAQRRPARRARQRAAPPARGRRGGRGEPGGGAAHPAARPGCWIVGPGGWPRAPPRGSPAAPSSRGPGGRSWAR
jgi:hypothetical protein